ncbi:ArgP/LysG family DNA-binding transcriptional regulator [Pseudomonas putida]|uniref:ArgP/LysG family DNA-binding transcriptional regulator n=1 Tax=Pseudomonas putida TaxID=303 RepID=A0A2Z4RG10_PSEPU|nr:LysR family transcriptional regulator ArgP [Pseudomonas putida]AWY39877.1 ArgP/LysG family DNA-binding transcriptional regulator [Pseudomonas putida]
MLDTRDLMTFLAVIEEESFEAAARVLHVTPGAVSHRIKQLEESVGTLLVKRLLPTQVTCAGEVVLRLAQQVRMLQMDTRQELSEANNTVNVRLTIALNDDSLSTWFLATIFPVIKAHDVSLDLRMGDHEHTNQLLRDGTAIAAITTDPKPVRGCVIKAIGAMRYKAVATRQFQEEYFPHGLTQQALERAPTILFDRQDTMTDRFCQQLFGQALQMPVHYIPSSRNLIEAAIMGLGWCMAPQKLVREECESGRLVELAPDQNLDIKLFWQAFKLNTHLLKELTRHIMISIDD